MIPLGKGDHTEAPTTTSSSIADGTHNHSHATPAVSSVLSNDNTGDQSETARALVLAKLASCTQGREGMIVHLDQDKGRLTPTGADEVSRVIGSFPGIGALLDRMNVINAPDASTIHAYSHNASDPSRTVAHDASSTPAVSNSIAHGNAGDAPRDLTAEENTPIQTTTNTIGHLESNSPHGAINNEVSSLAHSGGETHHSNGLSDLQKEELGRVPDATHGTSSDDHAATGLAAGAAGATGLAGAENISSTAHTAPDGPSPAYTENVASQTASPRASRGGFAERLKQEIEDRAKASREGREYTGPGASAKVIAARDPSATVQDSPVKPAPTEATTKRTSVGHPGAAAAAPAVAATPETAAEPEGSRDETAAASVPASPVVQTRSRAGSTAGLTRNANESTESLGRSPSKSKGFGGLFRRNSKRASLPPSSTNASQVSLGNASAAPTATETKPANSAAPVPEGMGWKGKVSEPPIGANRRRTLTSGTSSGEAGVAAAAVGAVAAEEAEEAASHSADHNTSHSIEPQSSAAAAAPASTTANEIAIPAATTTSAAGLADSAGPSGHGPAHTSEAAAPTVEAGEAAAAAHDEVTPVAAEEAKPLPRSSSSGGFAAKLRQEIEERAKAARENRPYDGPGSSTTWVKARDPADPVPSPAKPFNEPSTRRSIDAPAAASAPEVSNVSAVVPPPAHAEADSAAASPLFPVRSRANSTISTNRDSYAAETSEPLTRSTSKSKGISGLFRRSSKRGTLPSASRNASQVSLGSTSGAVEPSDINHDKPSIAQAPLPEGAGWKGKVSEPPIGANRRRTLTSGTSGPEAAVAAAAAVHHVDSNDHTAQRSVDFEGSSAPRAETPTTHLQDRDHTAQRSSDFEGSSAVLAEIPAMHLQDSDHTAQRHHDFEGSAAVLPEPPVHHVDGHDHTAQRSSDFEGSAAVLPPVAVHHLDHHDHTVQRSSDFEDPTATDGARAAALAALEGRHHLPGTDANAAAPLAESTSDVVMHSNDEDLHRSDATEQRPSAFTEDFEGDNHAAPRESSENIGSRASYAGQSTESLSSPKKKGFLGGLFRRKSKRSSMPANYGSQSGSMVSLASVQSVDSTTTPAAPAGDIPAGMGWKGKVSEPPIGMNRRRTLTGGSASAETAAAAVAATEATEGHKDSTMVADEPAAHVEPEIRYDQTEDGMLPTVPEEGAIPETASYAERSADDHAHHHDDEAAAEAMSEEAEPVQAARPSGGGLAARLREEADARARAQREGKEYTGPGAANYIAPSKFASQPSEDVQHTSTEHAEPLTRYETSGTQRDSVAPTSATVPVYPQQTSATAADSAPKKKRFSFIFFRRHAKEEKAQPQYTPQPAYAERYQDNSEPDYRDEAESEHGYHDEAPHERDFPDDWSIGHIAAATPLPAPVYTPSVTAKRERIQRKRDHKAKIERERAEREANLLARQSRILDAYTGTQGKAQRIAICCRTADVFAFDRLFQSAEAYFQQTIWQIPRQGNGGCTAYFQA